jgi:hypothetical protein
VWRREAARRPGPLEVVDVDDESVWLCPECDEHEFGDG